MTIVLYFIAKLISILLEVVSTAMLIQALMSFFMPGDDNKFYLFLHAITEPFVMPVRFILNKLGLLEDSPIDWSFVLAYILISILTMLLPAI
ncbi:MAG: YggT family protein [Clostridia bacterium]|nr:YggT family protein [Clostridia bacterium]